MTDIAWALGWASIIGGSWLTLAALLTFANHRWHQHLDPKTDLIDLDLEMR